LPFSDPDLPAKGVFDVPLEFIQANILTFAIAVASGVMLVWPGLRRAGETVDPGRATLLINRESARVIDVREAHEYAAGHLPDALNLPQKTLAERIGELDIAKDQPLILVCTSGVRSGQACAQLKKMGFTRLYNLDGGIGAWERAGLPIKRGSKKK
jgi:rhodanese-related sulfurtransferase